MSVLGKLMFWKSKDDFSDLGLGKDPMMKGMQGMPSMKEDFGMDFSQGNFGQSMDPMAGNFNPATFGQSPSNPQLGQAAGFGSATTGQGSEFRGFGNGFSGNNQANQFASQYTPQNTQYNPHQDLENKNLEIISSKLDALRAAIENLNQRLANLEAIARGEDDQRKRGRYY